MKLFIFITSLLITLFTPTSPTKPIRPAIDYGDDGGFGGGDIFKPIVLSDTSLSFCMEPLSTTKKESNAYFAYLFTTSKNIQYNLEVYIVNDLYSSGSLIYSDSGTIFFTTKYFTYDNKKTRSTNTIKIVSTIDGVTTTYTREIGLSSRDTRTVSEGLSFTPTSKCIYLLNGVWQDDLSIKYSFIDYPSCLIPSYYHELCIDQLSITCSDYSMAKVTCKDINLVITNRNGVFNDLGATSTSLILPLTLEFNGTTGKLKFKNIMYVDPTTLMMSSTKKSGYVATNHLYFPRNEMKYQGEYEFNVLFTNFGINKTSVSSKHTIKALINTLGDCYNSEYCIINNDAEINDLGWAI